MNSCNPHKIFPGTYETLQSHVFRHTNNVQYASNLGTDDVEIILSVNVVHSTYHTDHFFINASLVAAKCTDVEMGMPSIYFFLALRPEWILPTIVPYIKVMITTLFFLKLTLYRIKVNKSCLSFAVFQCCILLIRFWYTVYFIFTDTIWLINVIWIILPKVIVTCIGCHLRESYVHFGHLT